MPNRLMYGNEQNISIAGKSVATIGLWLWNIAPNDRLWKRARNNHMGAGRQAFLISNAINLLGLTLTRQDCPGPFPVTQFAGLQIHMERNVQLPIIICLRLNKICASAHYYWSIQKSMMLQYFLLYIQLNGSKIWWVGSRGFESTTAFYSKRLFYTHESISITSRSFEGGKQGTRRTFQE